MSRDNDGGRSSLHAEVAAAITAQRLKLAEALVQREFSARPELGRRYGETGREKAARDAGYHLSYLAAAIRGNSPMLFVDYIGWAKVVLAKRGVPASVLAFHLECMRTELAVALPAGQHPIASAMVAHALRALPRQPDEPASFILPKQRYARLARAYLAALLRWDRSSATKLIMDAAEADTPIEELYLHVFQSAQCEVGRLWQINAISVAQEHYCSAATQLIMSLLYPRVFATEKHGGTFVAAGVCGDMHEIGVRMISDVFELSGWDTCYLGANVPIEGVVQAVTERAADVLGISATIAYHVEAVEDLVRQVRNCEHGARVKILVGGYPFNVDPDLWRKVGADGFARDAVGAVPLARRLAKVQVASE
jgi:MerR family transcriptional regulator, light-induced transcriptional regulator